MRLGYVTFTTAGTIDLSVSGLDSGTSTDHLHHISRAHNLAVASPPFRRNVAKTDEVLDLLESRN